MGTDVAFDGLIDTSVLVDLGDAPPSEHPGTYAVSVLSLAEMHRGAILASRAADRAVRIARLASVEKAFEALPIDRAVAIKFGEISARTRRLERPPHVIDGLIAATAIVHGVPVITRDDDFDRIPGVKVVKV